MLKDLQAIIIIVLLGSSIFSIKFSLFDLYHPDNYRSIEIPAAYGDDPVNSDSSIADEIIATQPQTENGDQSTDPSTNEGTTDGGTDLSTNEVANGCDLSSANPDPGCVDVDPGYSASKKKKHPIDPIPSKCNPCANNTSGGGPAADDNSPPNETVPPSECDEGSSLGGIFQGAFGACNGGPGPGFFPGDLAGLFNGGPAPEALNNALNGIPQSSVPSQEVSNPQSTSSGEEIRAAQTSDTHGSYLNTLFPSVDAVASVKSEICNDNIDNDHNGLIDGEDPSCASSVKAQGDSNNFLDNMSRISHFSTLGHKILKLSDIISSLNATTFANQSAFLKINGTNQTLAVRNS
jgi:hypothetical protein